MTTHTTVIIEEPHGYLFDADGNVALRFANFNVGEHQVPEYVDGRRSPEYVDGPTAHTKPLADAYTET